MPTKLRDKSEVLDPRLDRLRQFDERSRNFPVTALPQVAAKLPRSYTWSVGQVLDQGNEGACVGFSFGHELIARPRVIAGIDNRYARETIYWAAQRDFDTWEGGAYPGASPFYEGTSVLAGAKAVTKLGHYKSYHWAFSLDEMILAVGYAGPCVIGVNWYTGMFNPDEAGVLTVSGKVAGGHAILVNGVSLRYGRFTLVNSWGAEWGIGGRCFVTFADMQRLLSEGGEVCCVQRA